MQTVIRIELNGAPHEVADGATVAAVVRGLGLPPEAVAVELNRRLVQRSAHERTVLRDGDRVEIVTLVGGG